MSPGFYGKLPSQGDFVSRRLPWEFTSGWDEWLQVGLFEAKQQLGDGWLERYLTSPVWRFQLAPGVLGVTGWMGLWFPSVDRVGRHFPLTLAVRLPSHQVRRYTVLEFESTLLDWEDAALRALDPKLGFEAWDVMIQSLPEPPWQYVGEVGVTKEHPLPLATSAVVETAVFDVVADASVVLEQVRLKPVQSCFFSWGDDNMRPTLCRSAGLLPSTQFRGFFDGCWLQSEAIEPFPG